MPLRNLLCLLLLYLCHTHLASGQLLTGREHKTYAASEKANNLTCFSCGTLEEGERCSNLSANFTNELTTYIRKCPDEMRICMVKVISYTTSVDQQVTEPKMWSLERNCSSRCEPGCIVIGERTKLYACTKCCDSPLCNVGKAGAPRGPGTPSLLGVLGLLLLSAAALC